jgi:hypothetical protein
MYSEARHASPAPFAVTLNLLCTKNQPMPRYIIHTLTTKHRSRLHYLAKRRNKCLRKPEGEDELGAGHEKLGRETLEERSETLILHHARYNSEAAFGVFKVPVLDTGLDDIERG